MADYTGPTDLVIRSGLDIIRLSISNRDEIIARPDFAETWKNLRVLILRSNGRGYYELDARGTPMLEVTGIWNKQYREKYGE